jgi:hypothetical protein
MKKELERLGFERVDTPDIILYRKYNITIEKVFCGYLINKPYKIFKTIDELKNIIKFGK